MERKQSSMAGVEVGKRERAQTQVAGLSRGRLYRGGTVGICTTSGNVCRFEARGGAIN